jgi:hypothetical protein
MMVKRILFGLAAFVALVAGGTALANASPLKPALSRNLVQRNVSITQPIQRVAQPMVNYWWFPQSYEAPVNHYDWSRWFNWLQPD